MFSPWYKTGEIFQMWIVNLNVQDQLPSINFGNFLQSANVIIFTHQASSLLLTVDHYELGSLCFSLALWIRNGQLYYTTLTYNQILDSAIGQHYTGNPVCANTFFQELHGYHILWKSFISLFIDNNISCGQNGFLYSLKPLSIM